VTAVFTSVDPLVDSTHRPYDYVDEDPLNGVDPDGRTLDPSFGGHPIWIGTALPSDQFCTTHCRAAHYWRNLGEFTAAAFATLAAPEIWAGTSTVLRAFQ
jgi:hypothetical protein